MPKRLIVCTLCQRVQRGGEWVETERMIRELRSYELDSIPHSMESSATSASTRFFCGAASRARRSPHDLS